MKTCFQKLIAGFRPVPDAAFVALCSILEVWGLLRNLGTAGIGKLLYIESSLCCEARNKEKKTLTYEEVGFKDSPLAACEQRAKSTLPSHRQRMSWCKHRIHIGKRPNQASWILLDSLVFFQKSSIQRIRT